MATFNSEIYEAQQSNAHYPHASLVHGKLRYAVVNYKTSGTEAAGDTVNLVKLPAGVLPLPALSHVVHKHAAEIKVSLGTEKVPGAWSEEIRLHGSNVNVNIGFGTPPAWITVGNQSFTPAPLVDGDELVQLRFDTNVTFARDITIYLAYIAE